MDVSRLIDEIIDAAIGGGAIGLSVIIMIAGLNVFKWMRKSMGDDARNNAREYW